MIKKPAPFAAEDFGTGPGDIARDTFVDDNEPWNRVREAGKLSGLLLPLPVLVRQRARKLVALPLRGELMNVCGTKPWQLLYQSRTQKDLHLAAMLLTRFNAMAFFGMRDFQIGRLDRAWLWNQRIWAIEVGWLRISEYLSKDFRHSKVLDLYRLFNGSFALSLAHSPRSKRLAILDELGRNGGCLTPSQGAAHFFSQLDCGTNMKNLLEHELRGDDGVLASRDSRSQKNDCDARAWKDAYFGAVFTAATLVLLTLSLPLSTSVERASICQLIISNTATLTLLWSKDIETAIVRDTGKMLPFSAKGMTGCNLHQSLLQLDRGNIVNDETDTRRLTRG